jgi:hypothetical protein
MPLRRSLKGAKALTPKAELKIGLQLDFITPRPVVNNADGKIGKF